jgi:hypothetical protein
MFITYIGAHHLHTSLMSKLIRYPTQRVGVQMGSLRGRPRRGRFPSELLSETRFMVKGPLKGPGST